MILYDIIRGRCPKCGWMQFADPSIYRLLTTSDDDLELQEKDPRVCLKLYVGVRLGAVAVFVVPIASRGSEEVEACPQCGGPGFEFEAVTALVEANDEKSALEALRRAMYDSEKALSQIEAQIAVLEAKKDDLLEQTIFPEFTEGVDGTGFGKSLEGERDD